MKKEIPLVDNHYLLERFPGKSGWTYAAIPEVVQDRHAWFGWVKVSGKIDDFEFNDYKLMPMGNGRLFLPVRTEIRKRIGKQAGDWVHVVLYAEVAPTVEKDDLMICLAEDPEANQAFQKLTEEEQKTWQDWIFAAKSDDHKVKRIAETLDRLASGQKRI